MKAFQIHLAPGLICLDLIAAQHRALLFLQHGRTGGMVLLRLLIWVLGSKIF